MRFPLILIVLATLFGQPCVVAATSGPAPMSAADQARLARFFAPDLLFHPDEQFYPTDIFTPLGNLDEPTAEDARALAIERRVQANLATPVAQRLRQATVYYRVTPLDAPSGRRAAIEYFFYYLYNQYRVRGGVLPLAFNTTHFHDFESLTIIVAWADATADGWDPSRGRVEQVHPSDHGRDVPDNVWRADGNHEVPRPLHVLVELGSHAMAADMNGNGRFDPGIDANERTRFVWGIRDRGATMSRFKPGYMVTREPGRSVELAGPDIEQGDGPASTGYSYALAPVSQATDGIALIARLAGPAAFGRASWTVRLFGDTDPRTVVRVPDSPADTLTGSEEAAAAAYEHGLSVGISSLLGVTSVYGGGRWLVVGRGRLPDLLIDGQVAVNNEGRLFLMPETFASRRLDFMSRLLVGVGVLADARRLQTTRIDLLAGIEFRLGHLRVRPLARRNHSLRRTWADVRVSYVF